MPNKDEEETSVIMPIEFGPAPASGVHFPSIILEVTPDEYEKIKTGELVLPNGWEIGEEIPRAAPGHSIWCDITEVYSVGD